MKVYLTVLGICVNLFNLIAQTPMDSLKADGVRANKLEEIVISSERIIDRSSVSDISLSPKKVETSKGLYDDPLRSITFFPGVTKGGGDIFSATQIYVRGGAPGENLFMLDNVKIYYPWYQGGIKSVFNTETIDNIELLTGGFSAKYGNAMSSVMNVSTRDGNFEKYHGNASIGFSNTQLMLEGPVLKDNLSFLVSARRSIIDLIVKKADEFPIATFGDVTYKLSYKVNDKNKVAVNGIHSLENTILQLKDPKPGDVQLIDTKGVSQSQSILWSSIVSSKLLSKLSLIHAKSASHAVVGRNLNLNIGGTEWGFREDMTYYIFKDHKLIVGTEYSNSKYRLNGYSSLDPNDTDPNDSTVVLRDFDIHSNNHVAGVYASYLASIKKISINAGIRTDYDQLSRNFDPSPRASVSFVLNEQSTLRVAYGLYRQRPETEAINNNKDIKSNLCTHYIVGYSNHFKNRYKGWIEVYSKRYSNLVMYDTTLDYTNNGYGFSNGVELFFSKQLGNFTGWISYALSVSKRRESMQDRLYYFPYDRRHVGSVLLQYECKDKKNPYIPDIISTNFSYTSGTPYTPVKSAVSTPYGWIPVKGEPFSQRNPGFININFKIGYVNYVNKKKTIRMVSFGEIWNLLNSQNVTGRFYQYSNAYPNNVQENIYYSTPFIISGGAKIEF